MSLIESTQDKQRREQLKKFQEGIENRYFPVDYDEKVLEQYAKMERSTPELDSYSKVKEKAMRFNNGKLKWSYVHFGSLEPMVRVLMYGAEKYAPENWKKGLDMKEILESMQRHLCSLLDGEVIDPESGLPHMGHVQCNAMFYNYFHNKNNNNGTHTGTISSLDKDVRETTT